MRKIGYVLLGAGLVCFLAQWLIARTITAPFRVVCWVLPCAFNWEPSTGEAMAFNFMSFSFYLQFIFYFAAVVVWVTGKRKPVKQA